MNFATRFLLRAALAAALACVAAGGRVCLAQEKSKGAAGPAGRWSRLEETVARLLREGEVPGAAVAVVRGGRVVAQGVRRQERRDEGAGRRPDRLRGGLPEQARLRLRRVEAGRAGEVRARRAALQTPADALRRER